MSLLDPSRLWLLDDHRLGRKEPNMMLIGADYHRSFHTIAFFVEGLSDFSFFSFAVLGVTFR